MNRPVTRRDILKTAAAAGSSLAFPASLRSETGEGEDRFKIGACDWSIGKGSRLEAMDLAAEIGLDGVQVSFGPPGQGADLREEATRKAYEDASKRTGVAIASLAMGCLNQIPLATDPRAETYVEDCIGVMGPMGQNRLLLAFFGEGDVREEDKLKKLIAVLKRLAPKAEKAQVVLGIESWLDAETHLRLIDAVGSAAVKVYYDVANMETRGYPLYEEIRFLGRKGLICEVHAKENGALIGEGKVDFRKVRSALDDIGYSGWLVLEGAVPPGAAIVESYKKNLRALRSIFGRE